MNRLLALDVGQTGVRARVLNSDNSSYEVDLAHHRGIRTDLELPEQLTAVASSIIEETGPTDSVAVGSTGFTGTENVDRLRALAPLGVRDVLLAHDSITSYLGALGDEEGAVVAAGTGVVTLAVGADSVTRVDGWGHIMGDAGSGYWFGRAALDAAMRAYDGRGPETVLLDRLREEFGDIEGAYIELQADPARIRRVASFSKWVTEAERMGDRVAGVICRRGAAELALSVSSGLDRVGIAPDKAASVCTIGGIFRSDSLAHAFTTEIAKLRPHLRRVEPLGDSLDGAMKVLTLAPGSPLRAYVTHIALS